MIRNQLVVGLKNEKLSEKLQLDETLSLQKAVNIARQNESVHKQQAVIRGANIVGDQHSNVDAISRPPRFHRQDLERKEDARASTPNPSFKNPNHGCQRGGHQTCPAAWRRQRTFHTTV